MEKRSSIRDPARWLEVYSKNIEFWIIGSRAVQRAQQRNRELGIPNSYSRNGKIYFELPNGELTDVDPYENEPKGE